MEPESASSPPVSSSPAPMTPSDISSDGALPEKGRLQYSKESSRRQTLLSTSEESPTTWEHHDLETALGQASFPRRLDRLLLAVRQERLQLQTPDPLSSFAECCHSMTSDSDGLSSSDSGLHDDTHSGSVSLSLPGLGSQGAVNDTGTSPDSLSRPAYPLVSTSTKRPRSDSEQSSHEYAPVESNPAFRGSTRKKSRLTYNAQRVASHEGLERKRSAKSCIAKLSGAFGGRYARGPGSLRRAESLRSDILPVRNGAAAGTQDSPTPHVEPQRAHTIAPGQTPPASVGSGPTPTAFDGYAPTVPTTPTALAKAEQKDGLTNLPIIAPPPFELIPRAPLSKEDAADGRIACLLAKELELRTADGLQIKEPPPKRQQKRTEDEEERFWMDDEAEFTDENDVEAWLAEEEARECRYRVRACGRGPLTRSPEPVPRARTASTPIQLGIGDVMLEDCMNWILEIIPSDESESETSYVPGDLYHILSTSSEVRFHAGHLFLRYFSLVGSPTASDHGENPEAFEAVTWDIAVACLAISVKFHRDVLYPLDVIYAHEYIDLAPHALTFDDLENAQRDVLEALAFRVGSATPGAFMAELWAALPTLRLLVAFDGGWEGVQESAWTIVCNALQDPDVLRYPVSLLTAAALIEGILEVLAQRYKTTKIDGRGRALKKRDEKTLRKAALKASRGVRLDIKDVLGISDDELAECRQWLGVIDG